MLNKEKCGGGLGIKMQYLELVKVHRKNIVRDFLQVQIWSGRICVNAKTEEAFQDTKFKDKTLFSFDTRFY